MTLKLVKYLPPPPLSEFVESILYVEGNNKGAGLPKTAMSLVFNLGDGFKLFHDGGFGDFTNYRRHWVAGMQTEPRYVESYGVSKMILIQFRTTGVAVFFRHSMNEFTDRYVPLDGVVGHEADETWEQLMCATDVAERFRITSSFLENRLRIGSRPHGRLVGAVEQRLRSTDRSTIDEICREMNVSRKHLNQLFKSVTGVSPKMLSSLYRFQRILKTISMTRPERLTDFAYELEYFDQSHFNNDFKRFTRLKPSQYMTLIDENPSIKAVPHFLPVLTR